MYDLVLLPVAGPADADASRSHAVDLAVRHDATLDVLHVTLGEEDEAADDVTDAVDRVLADARDAGVDANTASLSGAAAERILDYVEDRGVDVVVMASHGRRGLNRAVDGSVAETVIRSAGVPVLVVPLDEFASDGAG